MKELVDYRKELDQLDKELIDVLAKRFLVNREVKRLKSLRNIPMIDPIREKEMIKSRRNYAKTLEIDPDFIEEIFWKVLEYVRGEKEEKTTNAK